MTSVRTVVFDLDGTLVETAPDLINALNFVLGREGLPAIAPAATRNMIGAGARRMIERGLKPEDRVASVADINRLTADFVDHYAAHIADEFAPVRGPGRGAGRRSQASGYRLAVCTNKLEWLSKLLLDRLGPERALRERSAARTRLGVAKPEPGHPAGRRWRAPAAHSPRPRSWSANAGPDVGAARRAGIAGDRGRASATPKFRSRISSPTA